MKSCGIISSKMQIISLLSAVHREGMDNVLAYLENSDYFTAHCHHHHRYKGGLAEHSLGVYFEMISWAPELPDDSCRSVALLHDLCTSRLEGYNDIGRPHHGQRSVELLDALGLELHDDERLAISRHMHHVPESQLSASTALWHYLHFCDRRSASYHMI